MIQYTIEARIGNEMNILGDVTEGIHPVGGFKRGEMAIYSGGRGTGKSLYYNLCQEIMLTGQTSLAEMMIKYDVFWNKPEKVNKYKFSRKWHVAEFDWVHHAEVLEWCTQQFGPHPRNPDAWSRWQNKYSEKIHLRDEQDYVLFVLRWS